VSGYHALRSPSGAEGWCNCPGKPAMEQGLPDTPSEHSRYGTVAHHVAYLCLINEQGAQQHHGWEVEGVIVDDEMVSGVQCYIDMVRQRIADYYAAGAVAVEMFVEQEVPIGHITGEEGATGTADCVLIVYWADDSALLDVIDLKFGVGVKVYAEENKQLILYALGAVEKFASLVEFDRVRMTIHQPRVDPKPSEWEISAEDLKGWGESLSIDASVSAVASELNEYPDGNGGQTWERMYLSPGGHCAKTFCKAQATCPALAKFVSDSVGADFDEMPTMEAKPIASDGIASKFKAISIIEAWCKAVRSKAEALLFEHNNSPEIIQELGIKLVQGKQGNRAWASKEEAETVLKSMRLRQEEMYDFSLISPTAAEKLLAETPKRWKRIEHLITRAPGKPSVAEASDKRPALVIGDVTDDFESEGDLL
jgi:hypothetical protein